MSTKCEGVRISEGIRAMENQSRQQIFASFHEVFAIGNVCKRDCTVYTKNATKIRGF